MRCLLLVGLLALALISTSCFEWVERVVGPAEYNAYVMIESDTYWSAEIDGLEMTGFGDHTIYLDADCAAVEKTTYCGYVQLTVNRCGDCPATSYTNAPFGEIEICD
jgi:hypothetical protein